MPQNEISIPESVMNEWKEAAVNYTTNNYESSYHAYIEGCKSQYPFREKNKVLRDALLAVDDYLATTEDIYAARQIISEALKQTQ